MNYKKGIDSLISFLPHWSKCLDYVHCSLNPSKMWKHEMFSDSKNPYNYVQSFVYGTILL